MVAKILVKDLKRITSGFSDSSKVRRFAAAAELLPAPLRFQKVFFLQAHWDAAWPLLHSRCGEHSGAGHPRAPGRGISEFPQRQVPLE